MRCAGHGQVISLVGEAGLGKSRLVAEAVHQAHERGFSVYGGECESYGVNTSYLVWQPIWRALFGLEARLAGRAADRRAAAAAFESFDPALARRHATVGPVLGLSIPDNDLTLSFDAKLRKSSLETLLADILAAMASELPILIVVEDAHWLDPLSHDLLEVIGRDHRRPARLDPAGLSPRRIGAPARGAGQRLALSQRNRRWRPSRR